MLFFLFLLVIALLVIALVGFGFVCWLFGKGVEGINSFFSSEAFLETCPTIYHLFMIAALVGGLYMMIDDHVAFFLALVVLSPAWGIWLVWTLAGGPQNMKKRMLEERARNTPDAIHERTLRARVERQLANEELERIRLIKEQQASQQRLRDHDRMVQIRKEILQQRSPK